MSSPNLDPDRTARLASDAPMPHRQGAGEAQFAPGTVVAGRYRIASILGAGGMGEVYRAEDTKLGQTVALKFLPARLARDPLLLGRLLEEVRLGRQITHPNVCRIYDIVEWGDAHFVAMEYVDGEDLARLLRRIGRLAHDKAVEIARGVAAGLAAAHSKGILHRDLKPANIMIDSRGDARIMDFGLALGADEDDGTVSGTPAYMAPELLEGRPASVRSDVYALGLVMYELFTGKRVHAARTLPERAREIGSDITTPSSVIRDMDAAVERLILRSLSPDPAQRPSSAREIFDALPGGDPLAAAVAAGETPSPRAVAAAGSEGTLSRRAAWSLLLGSMAMIAALLVVARAGSPLRNSGLTRPPDALAARAADLLRGFGMPEGSYRSTGYRPQDEYLAWVQSRDRTPDRWSRIRRGLPVVTFWLREESAPLIDSEVGHTPTPAIDLPPQHAAGSAAIEIDPRGRLYSLSAIPSPSWQSRTLDWNALLAAAGLSPSALTPADPRVLPAAYADARAAWTGRHPEDGTPIRVEAAAFRGVPVLFRIVAPWNEVDALSEVPFGGGGFYSFITGLVVAAMLLGVLLAWRNLRLRRGDRAGAARLAAALFAISFCAYLAAADHQISLPHELRVLTHALMASLLSAAGGWVVYIALEPHVRRHWPQGLISWTRLIGGSWHDPMIGRDVLIGITGGLLHVILATGVSLMLNFEGIDTAPPVGSSPVTLSRVTLVIAHIFNAAETSVVFGLALMILLVILTIIFRNRTAAAIGLFAVMFTGYLFASTELRMLPWFVLLAALFAVIVSRYGLLSTVAMQTTFVMLFTIPLPDAIAWYTPRAMIPTVVVIGVSVWAFRRALGEQRAFAEGALD